ncbi:hypothetical protein N9M52_00405 [bacterium]|nr:hypothetical protein [bacterium]
MINKEAFTRTKDNAGVVNTDSSAYMDAMARRQRDKYTKGLEKRIVRLESAMNLLQSTIEEISNERK